MFNMSDPSPAPVIFTILSIVAVLVIVVGVLYSILNAGHAEAAREAEANSRKLKAAVDDYAAMCRDPDAAAASIESSLSTADGEYTDTSDEIFGEPHSGRRTYSPIDPPFSAGGGFKVAGHFNPGIKIE